MRSSKFDKSKTKKVLLIVLGIFLALLLGGGTAVFVYTQNTMNKMVKTEFPEAPADLGITVPQEVVEKSKIKNILLMGVDKQENASDSMIVLTIDEENKKVKMTSIMRDSKVDLGPAKISKLNYAYHYGGPLLTVKTINEVYKLDIMNYLKVDFEALSSIVNILGGVEIKITANEMTTINSMVETDAKLKNKKAVAPLTASGLQKLNGDQALEYSRIRVIGDDFQRTQRQRTVLNSLFNKMKDTAPTSYPSILSKIAPLVETSLENSEIIDLLSEVALNGKNGIAQARLPLDNTWRDDTSTGTYYLLWEKKPNLEYLHKFIYGDTSRLSTTSK